MRHIFQFAFASQVAARTKIARFKIPASGTLAEVRIETETPNGAGDTVADVNLGNTEALAATIFPTQSDRPRILAGASFGVATGLPVNVTKGQTVTIDLDGIPAGGTGAFYVSVTIEDNTGAGLVVKTAQVVTSALAASASENLAVTLARCFILLAVETSAPARVRLYQRGDKRTADASRTVGVEPSGEHGVILDAVTATGALKLLTSPDLIGTNKEGFKTGDTTPRSADIPAAITNLSGGAAAITVTFTFYVLEA